MIGVAIKMQFKGIRMQFNTRRNGEGRNANIIYNPWKNLLNILTNYGPLIFFAEKENKTYLGSKKGKKTNSTINCAFFSLF